jgi:hypothetical protein
MPLRQKSTHLATGASGCALLELISRRKQPGIHPDIGIDNIETPDILETIQFYCS